MSKTVTVVVNQQQAEILERLIAGGAYGSTYGEVIRYGFLRYCEKRSQHLAQGKGPHA